MKLFRRALLLPLVVLLGALVAACVTSGPQKALNDVADALSKNDGGAFLAQLDMKPFATNQIKNMTREDQALNALDSMGRLLGLGCNPVDTPRPHLFVVSLQGRPCPA